MFVSSEPLYNKLSSGCHWTQFTPPLWAPSWHTNCTVSNCKQLVLLYWEKKVSVTLKKILTLTKDKNTKKNITFFILHKVAKKRFFANHVRSQTYQGAMQCSLCCTIDEHSSSCCAHGQQVCLLLHLHRLRFPLLPLRPLLTQSIFKVMILYIM